MPGPGPHDFALVFHMSCSSLSPIYLSLSVNWVSAGSMIYQQATIFLVGVIWLSLEWEEAGKKFNEGRLKDNGLNIH